MNGPASALMCEDGEAMTEAVLGRVRALARESAALRPKLAALHSQCFGWALSLCDWRQSDAEDVLQAAYLKVLDGRARFEGRSSFKTWVFGVIRKTALEHRRSQRFRSWIGSKDDEGCSDGDQQRVEMLQALSRLSRRQRQSLQLVFYHGLTLEEASGVMGVSIGSARTHYHRGKERLKKLLEEES